MKDYYNILDINKDASDNQIKKAYHKLVWINHSDKGGNVDKFIEILEAYNILSNKYTRESYDLDRMYNHICNNLPCF